MKTTLCRFFAVVAFATIFAAFTLPLFAQDLTANPSTVIPAEVQALVLGFFADLVKTHPSLATLISIMGLCRVFAKPIFSLIHAVIDLTPSKRDDGFFNSAIVFFSTNWLGKILAFVIDWTTSIKLVSPTKETK